MFSIEVEFLTGCYTATQHDDRNKPEWPPHPARLYSALVNAWAEADDPPDEEQAALRWLEGLADPEVSCSRLTADIATSEVATRAVVTHFVPDNDPRVVRDLHRTYEQLQQATEAADDLDEDATSKGAERTRKALNKAIDKARSDSYKAATTGIAPDSALALLPDLRGKQGRTYPTVRPADPVVTYTWPGASPDVSTRAHLDALSGRVGRLGHSSSFVSCRVVDAVERPATYVPRSDGETLIRLPGTGQFDRLREMYDLHQGSEPRSLPKRIVRYGTPGEAQPRHSGSLWHNATFVAVTLTDGPRVSVRDSLTLAQAARSAILAHAGDVSASIPESISGHVPRDGSDGSSARSQRPHMAVVPLPFAGFRHADGLIKGVAILLPDSCSAADRDVLFRAINRWTGDEYDNGDSSGKLWVGSRTRSWTVRREPELDRPQSLRVERWARPSRRWATVTPIVLDRYPDALWSGSSAKRTRGQAQAAASIRQACETIELDAPRSVEVRPDAPVTGAQPVRRHPTFRNGARSEPRPSVHAVIEFEEPVAGPVIIGRGRYLGQGLCAPLQEEAR